MRRNIPVRALRALVCVACLLAPVVARAQDAGTVGEGEGEGEAPGAPVVDAGTPANTCTPGCRDEATETFCTASGQLVDFPCPDGEACIDGACRSDPALAGPGGFNCASSDASSWHVASFAAALAVVVAGARRRRGGRA